MFKTYTTTFCRCQHNIETQMLLSTSSGHLSNSVPHANGSTSSKTKLEMSHVWTYVYAVC